MVSERVQRQIDRLLDEAEAAMAELNWDVVLQRSQAALALQPDNADATTYIEAANKALDMTGGQGNAVQPAQATPQSETTTGTEIPTSFSDGRYVVKRFLGEGGKKKVYLAHDELLDRDIAFALIKSEGLDDISRERITREAQAMGRLGSHPHIVTVLDLGETPSAGPSQPGQPYMVIELLAGGDVEGVVDDAPDHKLPLETAVKIAIETCRGLEFAHSKGIIHRDLKPGNVWLTGDGTAKIGDFGLAVALDRSRLTQQGMMVGTVSYMPPEQAMGGEVTPKADLYSLGAMLYEMVAGRPPFLGDDNIAIIGQHINTQAVAPTWHRSDCPRPLEALIMRLLAKNPDERPDNAGDVRVALEAVDLSAAKSVEQAVDETHVLDSLAGDVFVGRQAEMDQLKAALEDALSGRGRMVTLVGEPGIGKTRTAQELATYAGLRGCQVLWGRCYEEQGVPPYWPWVQAIRSYVRDQDAEQLRSEMGSGAADIAEIVSDVKTQLPDLQPPTQLDSPEQARFRLFDSIAAFLKTASQRKPIVLMLDDLHWSDKPSLMFLEFLTRELSGARLLLIGTYRDVELSRQHPLAETLGELTRQRLFERVLLRGLSYDDVARFIEVSSGITPPVTLANAVHTQTEGNPLFVTEVVRLLVQEGELTQERVRDRDSWEIRVPEGVREVIGRRLNRLSERCNETLTVAAVVGREFTLTQLDRLIDDLTQDMVLDVLEEALTARLIEELPTSVGLYQFTHALMQETLVDELSLTRRVRLHARIAETLEALYGDDAESHAAELAHHFAQAEAVLGTEGLVRYSVIAGERALVSFANEDALQLYQRAFDASDNKAESEETAAINIGLAHSLVRTLSGDSNLAEISLPYYSRAFDIYLKIGNVPKALAIAEQAHSTQIILALHDIRETALKTLVPDSLQYGRILVHHAYGLSARSEEDSTLAEAKEWFDQALSIAKRSQDLVLEGQVYANLGNIYGFYCMWEESLEASLGALSVAKVTGHSPSKLRALLWAGMSSRNLGRADEAMGFIDLLGAEAELVRDARWTGLAAGVKIELLMGSGEWKMARDIIDSKAATRPYQWKGVELEYTLGDYESGAGRMDRLMTLLGQDALALGLGAGRYVPAFAMWAVSRITGATEHIKIADRLTGDAESVFEGMGNRNSRISVNAALAMSALMNDDSTLAEQMYAGLDRFQGIGFAHVGWCTSHYLALLAQSLDRYEESQVHFDDTLDFCRKAGYRPELAWSLCDYADMLTERNEDGDSDKATAMLDESLAISTELGMKPLMERVLSRREILKA